MTGIVQVADTERKLGEFGFAGDDHVVPFEVAALDARGRAVQLGPILDSILARHDYPEPVARLLAEAMVLTVLLGSSLKFEGKFILQTRTDGPVDMLVADFTTPGSLRAYARFDADRLEALAAAGETAPETLLGRGVLALTIDQGAYTQRYQGIVELDGTTLEEAAHAYFRQSEQIPTRVKLASAELYDRDANGKPRHSWRAGGMVVQFLPESPERMRQADLHGGDGYTGHEFEEDDTWAEAQMLAATVSPIFRRFGALDVRRSVRLSTPCTRLFCTVTGIVALRPESFVSDFSINRTCSVSELRCVWTPLR